MIVKNTPIVVKNNKLIRDAKFQLSALEMDVVNHLIAQIGSSQYDAEFNTLEFSIMEFLNFLDYKDIGGSGYQYLKKVLKDLRDKSVYIELEDGTETTVTWIEKPKFHKRSGMVSVKLDDDMKPYLLMQTENFTQWSENVTKILDSKYSKRLYEILRSYTGIKKKKYSVEELKNKLNATAKTYEKYGIFKQKILAPVIDEINEKSDITVKYKEIVKKGKKVEAIEFVLAKKYKRDAIEAEFTEVEEEYDLNHLTDFEQEFIEFLGIKEKDKAEDILNLIETFVRDKYDEVDDSFKNGYMKEKMSSIKTSKTKINDNYAYLKKIIKNDIDSLIKLKAATPIREEIKPEWMEKQDEVSEEERQALITAMENWGKEEKEDDQAEILVRSYQHYLKWNNLEKCSEVAQQYKELTGKEIDEFEDVE